MNSVVWYKVLDSNKCNVKCFKKRNIKVLLNKLENILSFHKYLYLDGIIT